MSSCARILRPSTCGRSIPSEVMVRLRARRRYGEPRCSPPRRRRSVGQLLRDWRTRRRLSQLDLATEAGISARHLSFVETGRARPSREMVLHLAEHLDVPLRERNPLLIAAGYAPTYHATDLDAPEMQSVRDAVERLLAGARAVSRRSSSTGGGSSSSRTAAAVVLVEGVAPAPARAAVQRAARDAAPAKGSRRASSTCRSGSTTSSATCAARSR